MTPQCNGCNQHSESASKATKAQSPWLLVGATMLLLVLGRLPKCANTLAQQSALWQIENEVIQRRNFSWDSVAVLHVFKDEGRHHTIPKAQQAPLTSQMSNSASRFRWWQQWSNLNLTWSGMSSDHVMPRSAHSNAWSITSKTHSKLNLTNDNFLWILDRRMGCCKLRAGSFRKESDCFEKFFFTRFPIAQAMWTYGNVMVRQCNQARFWYLSNQASPIAVDQRHSKIVLFSLTKLRECSSVMQRTTECIHWPDSIVTSWIAEGHAHMQDWTSWVILWILFFHALQQMWVCWEQLWVRPPGIPCERLCRKFWVPVVLYTIEAALVQELFPHLNPFLLLTFYVVILRNDKWHYSRSFNSINYSTC